jgi:hypothetical protein
MVFHGAAIGLVITMPLVNLNRLIGLMKGAGGVQGRSPAYETFMNFGLKLQSMNFIPIMSSPGETLSYLTSPYSLPKLLTSRWVPCNFHEN